MKSGMTEKPWTGETGKAGLVRALARPVLAMLAFTLAGRALGEMFALGLMYLPDLTQDQLLFYFSAGTKLIDLFLAFPLFCLVMRVGGAKPAVSLRPRHRLTGAEWACYLLVALVPCGLASLIQVLFSHGEAQMSFAGELVVQTVFTGLMMPVMEEVMFRGLVLEHLRRFGAGTAVVVSALFFSVGHLNPVNIAVSLIPGLVLGYAALRTGGPFVWNRNPYCSQFTGERYRPCAAGAGMDGGARYSACGCGCRRHGGLFPPPAAAVFSPFPAKRERQTYAGDLSALCPRAIVPGQARYLVYIPRENCYNLGKETGALLS